MSFSESYTLSRKSGETQEFQMRRCTEADLEDIMNLQQQVYDRLGDPEVYSIVEEPEILESLKEDFALGTYHDGRLIAFTLMIVNRISHRNYGTYVNYPEERLPDCVSMEITIVNDEYRGYGLQKLFVYIREAEALRLNAKESFVTIAPRNEYSLRNLISSGYEIIETRPLYEGSIRHILRKHL